MTKTKVKTIDNIRDKTINEDYEFLTNLFKKKHPKLEYVVEWDGTGLSYNDLSNLKEFTKRRKRKLVSIDEIPSDIKPLTFGTSIDERNKKKFNDITGLFCVKIQDGDEMRHIYLLKRLVGEGKNNFVISLCCTDPKTQEIFLKLGRQKNKASDKPKAGIYEGMVMSNPMGGKYLKYRKLDIPTPPVMHQCSKEVVDSVDRYFKNKERYLRNGKSGSKRVLMFGNAGSGKSTLAYQIAKQYAKTHCIFFSTSVEAIAFHTSACAKFKMPTIVVAEECDKWMGSVDHEGRADGNVKAFLDGYMSHRNTAGEFSLLITNYANKIEKTILFRPGRIHERINVGALDAEHTLLVAQLYFKDEKGKPLCSNKTLQFLTEKKLTGAQIENIATMCVDYTNGTDKLIDKSVIQHVIDKFSEAVEQVREYEDDKTIVEKAWSSQGLGFSNK